MKIEFKIMFVVALLGLFSCNKEEGGLSLEMQGGAPISFDKISTRATLDDVETNGFKVWACLDNSNYTYLPLLTNEPVTYSASKWTYTNTRYWIDDSRFYFLASYPNNSKAEFTGQDYTVEGVKYHIYSLPVSTDGSASNDILVATQYVDTSDPEFNPGNAVALNFGHLLTKVNFKIQQDFDKDPANDYFITKVTLSGVKNEATYLAAPYGNNILSTWNLNSEITTFIKDFSEAPVKLRSDDPEPSKKVVVLSVWDNDGLLLIPQDIGLNDMKIRIDYIYHLADSDPSQDKERYITASLPEATNFWLSGKSIIYNLKVAEPSDITFGIPTVEPWGSPQMSGTIIIK